MHVFEVADFGPTFARLLDVDRNRRLDAGSSDPVDRPQFDGFSAKTAFEHAELVDPTMADACVAGVWLLHDYLDTSHTISQGIKTREGSFWHGIMHRREGDYSNAKYWFRNVGDHSLYGHLTTVARQIAVDHNEDAAREILGWTDWDPYRFVDLCQLAVQEGDGESLLQAIQQAEWELLFDKCYHAAIG